MKKVLGLLLASTLVLGACGNKEESKEEPKKEAKAPEKDKKKEKKDKQSKEENKETAENSNIQEHQNTQETVQSEEQHNVVEQPNQEQSQQNNHNSSGGTDAGLFDSDAAYNQIKKQDGIEKAEQESKEAQLQDEYFELSNKMYGDKEYSDEEMEAMENRQDAILDEVEPIN